MFDKLKDDTNMEVEYRRAVIHAKNCKYYKKDTLVLESDIQIYN